MYRISPPSLSNWIVILLLAFILNLSTYLLINNVLQAILIVMSITIFSVGSWYYFGFRITKLLATKYLISLDEPPSLIVRLILPLFGLKPHTSQSQVYIEGYTQNLQFRGFGSIFSVLKNRYFDVLSACFGVSLIILLAIGSVVKLTGESIFVGYIFLLLVSPFLVFWLIPLLWTIEDSGVKEVDPQTRRVWDVGYEIRKGFLSRFLGTAGIIAAFSYILSNIESIYEYYLRPPQVAIPIW